MIDKRKMTIGILIGVSTIFFVSVKKIEIEGESYKKEIARQQEIKSQEELEDAKLLILEKESKKAEKRRIENVGFNSNDVREPSFLTEDELTELLADTNMKSLAKTFIYAEKEYNVNAFVLTGLVALESGWNTSRRALEQYNLTGYGVYGDTARGKDFESPTDCILTTAKLLDEKYLTKDGECFNGYSINAINTMYSSDKEWYNEIEKIGTKLLNKYQKNHSSK